MLLFFKCAIDAFDKTRFHVGWIKFRVLKKWDVTIFIKSSKIRKKCKCNILSRRKLSTFNRCKMSTFKYTYPACWGWLAVAGRCHVLRCCIPTSPIPPTPKPLAAAVTGGPPIPPGLGVLTTLRARERGDCDVRATSPKDSEW
jgi:hypothetical protein